MSKFDEWFSSNFKWWDYPEVNAFPSLKEGAEAAWDEQQELLEKAIARLEGYPCDMSCYVTQDELDSAKRMKETMIRILKEEMS